MSKLKCFFCVKICVEPWTKTPRCKECHQERRPSSCRRHNRTSKCPRATGWPWTEISLIFKLKRIVATMTRMQQESLQGRGVYRAQFVPPQKQWFCLIFCPEAPGFFTDLKVSWSFVGFSVNLPVFAPPSCWFCYAQRPGCPASLAALLVRERRWGRPVAATTWWVGWLGWLVSRQLYPTSKLWDMSFFSVQTLPEPGVLFGTTHRNLFSPRNHRLKQDAWNVRHNAKSTTKASNCWEPSGLLLKVYWALHIY